MVRWPSGLARDFATSLTVASRTLILGGAEFARIANVIVILNFRLNMEIVPMMLGCSLGCEQFCFYGLTLVRL